MTTTVDTYATADGPGCTNAAASDSWALAVAHHRNRSYLGKRLLMLAGAQPTIGRASACFGPGDLFDSKRVSREHATLLVDEDNMLWIRDLDSRNGTYVNGERITNSRTLSEGDVVGIGRTLLVVHRSSGRLQPSSNGELLGISDSFERAREQALRVAKRETTVLLVGPAGAGKTALAEYIHRSSDKAGPLVVVSCAALAEDALSWELLGQSETARRHTPLVGQGLLEKAHNGTLLLEEVGDASERLQAMLVRFLHKREIHKAGASTPVPIAARVIATSTPPIAELLASGRLRADFARRVQRWEIKVPPLSERIEDIGLLMDRFTQRYAGSNARVHDRFALQLLRRAWSGNVAELEAAVEHATIASDSDTLIDIPAEARPSQPSDNDGAALRVAADGNWLQPAGKERILLGHRQALRRILATFVEMRQTRPGKALTMKTLVAAGWPEQRLTGDSGANRVYVALTTLRRMGLRAVIIRGKAGYFMAPSAPLVVERGAKP